MNRIIKLPRVLADTARSKSSIYNDIKTGHCTKPVKLGARSVGWPETEIAALNAARIAGKTDAEIRALVIELEIARQVWN